MEKLMVDSVNDVGEITSLILLTINAPDPRWALPRACSA